MRRLLIRSGAIGDCIVSLPAMEFLLAADTEVWVPAAVVPLIRFGDRVCALSSTGVDLLGVGDLPIQAELLQCLRGFDEIVSWYGSNRQEFRASLQAIGVACRFLPALPPPDSCEHAVDFLCAQVGAPSGAVPKICLPGDVQRRNRIVMHPFSGSLRKNWPLACFQEVARRVALPVEWLAGPEEVLADAHRFDDLGELAGWLRGARLYVGNDSGITHLAAAIHVPVLALFGPTSPAVWAPRGEQVSVVSQFGLSAEELTALIARALGAE